MELAVFQVLALLLVAAVVGMGARRLRLPYTLALVLAGIGLGLLPLPELRDVHLTPDLLLAIFLPALLFEAAYHVEFSKFRRNAGVIMLLAVPGVVLSVVVTALLSWPLLQAVGLALPLGACFLLATMIAATDPISVLALFRSLGVNRRLYLLVEGESLLNDGVAVVAFVIVAAVLGVDTGHGDGHVIHGLAEGIWFGLRTFVWMAGAGLAIGAAMGFAVSFLTKQIDDRLVETTLSFVLAYGSFLIAEHLHASGVLSCVAAGITLGSFGSRFGMSPATRLAVADFWEFLAFFSNSMVFLLVGLELDVPALLSVAVPVVAVFAALFVGRAVAVYGLSPFGPKVGSEPIPTSWRHVMVWGGLRGSLSMVLVIGLPLDWAPREPLLLIVFGVVSVSLFLQGLTMGPMLNSLGLLGTAVRQDAYEVARTKAMMASHALAEVEARADSGILTPATADRLAALYRHRKESEKARAEALAGDDLAIERLQDAALHLLMVEEEALRHAVDEGTIDRDAAHDLFTDIAVRREALRHGDEGPEALRMAVEKVVPDLREPVPTVAASPAADAVDDEPTDVVTLPA
jgi:CPA1 family monovalent cation:H+ antiporter